MSRNVADLLWEMLANAGVKRCYGIVGDALNPVIDGLRRNGKIEFIHVRHEKYGVFAAVAEACLAGNPVAVCGTAGPGGVHLFNGLMDARKEGAAVIAIAGDVETEVIGRDPVADRQPRRLRQRAVLPCPRGSGPARRLRPRRHLFEATVRPTVEVVLTTYAKPVRRKIDPESGLPLLDP
jgi:pyruvate dehydrogenase (quinone)